MSLTESLFDAMQALRGRAPSPAVTDRVTWTVLDNLGVMIHGSRLPEGRRFVEIMGERAGGHSASILGSGAAAPVERAAAAGAFLIHAAEIDDSDLRAQLRASAVVLPAVLAMAESADLSGADFVQATALAHTIQSRLATPTGPIQRFGWMSSGVWGPIAAAAAISHLLRLDKTQAVAAMGLAGSSAGGAFQYYYDQTEEKRIIVARGSRNAVESVIWARRGEGGPRRILEGAAGLYRLFGQAEAPSEQALFGGLERLEGPLFIHPKFYAASHSIIPTLDGIEGCLPTSVKAGQIDRFLVRADEGWANVVADKVNRFQPPETVLGAMLNYSFVVALFVARRSVMPADYHPATLADSEILQLAAKGSFEVVPTPADLSVEFLLKDGRRFLCAARTPGLQDQAAPDEARRLAKFHALARPHIGEAARERLVQLCRELPRAASMRAWCAEAGRAMT